MGVDVNVAVIMVRNQSTQTPPAVADVRTWWSGSRFSVARFWQDATYNWVRYPRFDYFGWFDVTLPAPEPGVFKRAEVVEIAQDAARKAGADLSPYNVFIALVAGQGAPDTGASGSYVSINVTDPHAFATHEFGHAIGYAHSYGIGASVRDADADGVYDPVSSVVYGDPYCIMSAQTYGGAAPAFDIDVLDGVAKLPGLPGAWHSGPPPARATVHYYMPSAIESAYRKVTHLYEGGRADSAEVNIAGGGSTGAELVVFHPVGEPVSGLGRVYVEYRMPSGLQDGTLWDRGLGTSPTTELDQAGLVVHAVVQTMDPAQPIAVQYSGKILFPTTDLDVTVLTPLGPVTVSVGQDFASQTRPGHVRVAIRRTATRQVQLFPESRETRVVVATETRTAPTLPGFTGEFTWEKREITRRTRYRPFVLGLGGSPIDGVTPVRIAWSVNGVALTAAQGTVKVPVPNRSSPVTMDYSIQPKTRELILTNSPADGTYSVPVTATATASSDTGAVTGSTLYTVAGLEEGWGDDYQNFQDWWHGILHPVPIEIIRPKWWLRQRLDRIETEIEAVEALNPDLAESMRRISAEQTRLIVR